MHTRILGGAVALLASTLVAPAALAAPPDGEEHCVLVVVDKAPDGELKTAPMVCDSSRSRALAAAGVPTARLADWAIGTHYDGAGFTGASVTVVGADCTGGWLNLPASWNDRISSTLHGCARIKHHLHVNLTGTSQTTYAPGSNLNSTLDDETSSIQYLP